MYKFSLVHEDIRRDQCHKTIIFNSLNNSLEELLCKEYDYDFVSCEKQIGLAIDDVDYGSKVGHGKICKPLSGR